MRSEILPKFTETRAVFAENRAHFSVRNAPHDHKNHHHPCKHSLRTFSRPCAQLAIVARVWRADFAQDSTENRAVFAEKSAQIGAKRAPNVRHKRKNNDLMVSEIFKAMQMPLHNFCEPCARIARENSAEIHRNPRGSRRKFARIFVAQRTARSHNAP